ncbi:(Fe-S)-binding protein [Ralstonia pseudosolanacearum]|uniref:Alpha-helical ferredoxin oxidoreductase protein n=1 Tax=Ralstonia nicotianae (strain ATCC BAA-1114 / GMI1000) TaxID=267608 RepID=Q8XTP7_RALN1|nr:(Fe-S)-binding protein [Ralstonia pseudosolanacearum]AKZ28147.1 (Fe-S)-binding protein [Ralstonia solanacearum]AST29146.1 (Fe-S)-binding protein [Ralstonia pseudosolanacearum]MCQ4677782.1 (Fe-S)-binding protein [Ralstonia pseudosolanacearum]MDC6285426.1 (Fe-S)-binding protein [Ralstonia pseudosolanacearum]CAD17210.1 putative alpha-helical ferredoxin; oxidoreductase protein [Ralstonia pseudosolanacearum GMI1000]
MNPAFLITALLWLSVAGLVFAVAKRASYWRLGRATAPGAFGIANLFTIPKRYFVDLHHVVARDPYIAKTHVATAGGAIAALALVFVNYGFAIYSPWLDKLIFIAALAMLIGAVFVWRRRAAKDVPARLSRGPWNTLPWLLGSFALGLVLFVVVPAGAMSGAFAVLCALLIGIGAFAMTFGAAKGGPMKHAMAGLLHLAFHPRQERFAGTPEAFTGGGTATPPTALKLPDIAHQEYGVAKPVEFRWNQLLSFDACVQCGKCEAACPAFASGQPLNPKKLIQDLVVGMAGGTDAAYAGSPTPGIAVGQHRGEPNGSIVSGLIEAQTLWSCTTCRACVQECPMLIEHVDAIVDMRRNQTLVHGTVPGKGPEVLANLRETGTMGGYDTAARYDWSVDLNAPIAQAGKPVDVLFVAGEGAFEMRYQRTLRAFVKVLNKAGVDYAVLGNVETDTGDIARRLGDEATFQQMAKRLIGTLSTLSYKQIVTADPHVMHSLRNEYRALGLRVTVKHHTTYLAELAASGKITPKAVDALREKRTTYHDPCYLGRYNGETDAPRKLLKTIGIQVVEMERNGMRGRCCGGGGGAPLTDIPGKQRIPDIRIADARAVNAEVVAVACPNCTAMLEGVVGPRPDVLDVAELVAASLE